MSKSPLKDSIAAACSVPREMAELKAEFGEKARKCVDHMVQRRELRNLKRTGPGLYVHRSQARKYLQTN